MDLTNLVVRIKLLIVVKVYLALHWLSKVFMGMC